MHLQPPDPTDFSPAPADGPGPRGGAPTVLVADDDDQVRHCLARMLRNRGYDVVVAENGQDAIRLLGEHVISLIVADLCMPEMDGIELMLHLRQRGRKVPVIAISGAMVGYTADMLQVVRLLGAQLTLQKPFPLSQLAEGVASLIGPTPGAAVG